MNIPAELPIPRPSPTRPEPSIADSASSAGDGSFVIGRQHGIDLPGTLSVMPEKLALYATDTHFLESWEDLLEVEPEGDRLLQDVATITFKPDAFAARAVEPALAWLADQGFDVIGAEPLFFDRATIRGIWLYQWNVASRDRKEVVDDLLGAGRSLVVFLRLSAGRRGPNTTASSHLSTIKGPATPHRREPGHLRTHLASPNTLLNFVHTADEPADLVRELGVYFAAPIRRSVYQRFQAGTEALEEALFLAREIGEEIPTHHLDLQRTLGGLRHRLGPHDDASLVSLLDDVRAGRADDWRALLVRLAQVGVAPDTWDRLVLTTTMVNMDNPRGEVLIRGVSSGLGVREPS